ncbi:tyrosine phosphatase family-domain-containing protein [Catenaria anguillulae PL171]|uniref:Tyrosine phosphatase family-domain-containing protein n=1 Tax=Catenaria anguillulae PL171 TaxID=765915 RepID=A0A1Y2HB79_9FUNG|nr:tyrosine phosphatase family-domain-containing protein [Catenaria anguillulae PL171]
MSSSSSNTSSPLPMSPAPRPSASTTTTATPLRRRSSLGSTSRPHPPPPLGATGSSTSASSSSSLLGQSSSISAAGGGATIHSLIVKATTLSPPQPTPLVPAPATAQPPLAPPTHVLPTAHPPAPLTIPDNFAQVEPGIYRSSLPSAASIPFLRTLALKTVLLLTPDLPSRAVAAWLDESCIQVIHLGAARAWGGGLLMAAKAPDGSGTPPTHPGLTPLASAPTSLAPLSTASGVPAAPSTGTTTGPPTWRPVSEDLVKDALQHLLLPSAHPILVACTTGIHETGTVIGCMRRMQRWNLNAIAFEYRQFADTKARYAAEQMIELFDVDWVVVPRGAENKVCGLIVGADGGDDDYGDKVQVNE